MDIVLTTEAGAWLRAADVAGAGLPDDIEEARANLERLEAEVRALAPVGKVPTTAELAASGLSLEQATEERARLAEEAERRREAHEAARPALAIARDRLSRLVAERRDELIVGIRPLLTALVDEARPYAETLAPFAPKHDAGAIVRRGKPEHLKAYQAAAELETRFGAVMAAWRASFQASTRQGGLPSPSKVPGFDPREVDQAHRFWERPELVANERLNGTHLNPYGRPTPIEPTVLSVANEPAEAGFRLATLRELRDVSEAGRLARLAEAQEQLARRRGRGVGV